MAKLIRYICTLPTCFRVVSQPGRCEKHIQPYKPNPEEHRERSRFYNSKRWRQVREMKLQLNPLCERCQQAGIITIAVDINHIVDRKVDPRKAFDLDNLESLCKRHHAIDSNQKRRK